MEGHSAAPGEFFTQQGAISDGRMFLVAYGHAQVRKLKQVGEAPHIVATLGPGSMFGEVALLLDTPRVASVVACGHCHAYTLSRDAFETLAAVYTGWWSEMMSERGELMKQLKSTGVGIAANRRTSTHNLHMPTIEGTSVSTMLAAVEKSAPSTSAVPEARLCTICRSAEKCVLSVPCGHISACSSCHPALQTCPLCRKSITSGMKAYF